MKIKLFDLYNEFVNDVNSVGYKYIRLIRCINFVFMCSIFMLPYYNFLAETFVVRLPVFSSFLQSIFSANIIIYIIVDSIILFVIYYFKKINKSSNKIKNSAINGTINDIMEIIILLFIQMKFVNDILIYVHNNNIFNESNKLFYILYLIYCLCLFIKSLYRRNYNLMYYNDKNYLPYFDSEGIQIAEEDKVIFYGCLYKVIYEKNETIMPGEWYLIKDNGFSTASSKGPLLEDAVKDKEGKITIFSPSKNRREKW